MPALADRLTDVEIAAVIALIESTWPEDDLRRQLQVCVTRAGATFMFSPDGRYEYEGLWKNGGQYEIGEGIVTVMFDSGLGRSFAISRHEKVFYMEETVLYCRQPEPLRS